MPSLSLCPSQRLRFVEEAFVRGDQTELSSYKSGQADANTRVNKGPINENPVQSLQRVVGWEVVLDARVELCSMLDPMR